MLRVVWRPPQRIKHVLPAGDWPTAAQALFIAALHSMGLCTLTHTPSPMGFLTKILGRPKNEKPYILFPIGYAAKDATVPDIRRKSLDEVSIWDPSPAE